MSPLTAIERRLPKAAVVALAATCACVLATGSAVAVSRSGDAAGKPAAKAKEGAPATPGKSGQAAKPPAKKPAPPKKPARPATVAGYLVPLQDKDTDYARLPDSIAGTGKIDLTKAAAIDSGDRTPSRRDKDLLKSIGFVTGHSRVWDSGDNTVVIYAYEWKSSTGAKAFVKGVEVVHRQRKDGWKPALRDAAGSCRIQDGEVVDGEVLAVGKHTFIIAVIREGTCRSHTEVQRVAKLQHQHASSFA